MNSEILISFSGKIINVTDLEEKTYKINKSTLEDKSFNEDIEVVKNVYMEIVKILKNIEDKKLLIKNENNEISDEIVLQKMYNDNIYENPYFFLKE